MERSGSGVDKDNLELLRDNDGMCAVPLIQLVKVFSTAKAAKAYYTAVFPAFVRGKEAVQTSVAHRAGLYAARQVSYN